MDDEIDLRKYASALWRWRWAIVAVVAAAVAGAVLFNTLSPTIYESEALVQLSDQSGSMYASPASAASVITSVDFLDGIANSTGLVESGRKLKLLVNADPVRDTRMIRLRVRYTSPEGAQRLADAIANSFVSKASERVREKRKIAEVRLNNVNAQLLEIERITRLARETLSRLQKGLVLSEVDRGFVRSFTLNSISISEALYSGLLDAQKGLVSDLLTMELATVVQKPSRPLASISPRRALNISLAAILGLMAGAMLAFVLEYFSGPRRVVTPSTSAALADAGREYPAGR